MHAPFIPISEVEDILTPEQFNNISSTPFVRPERPGPLNLPDHATQVLIRELKDIRNEKLGLFKEVNTVEATLIQQINTAIEPVNKCRPTKAAMQTVRNKIAHRTVTRDDVEKRPVGSFIVGPTV